MKYLLRPSICCGVLNLLLVLALTACGSPASRQYRAGVCQRGTVARWSEQEAERQCAQIDSMVDERVDLLLVNPINLQEVYPALVRAYNTGIPVLMSAEMEHGLDVIYQLEEQKRQEGHKQWLRQLAILVAIVLAVLIGLVVFVVHQLRTHRQHVEREKLQQQVGLKQKETEQQKIQLEAMAEQLEQIHELRNSGDEFVAKLQSLIDKHISDTSLNVELLASELGISRTQLFRKTRQTMGVSPLDLIRMIRLRRARQLILKTDNTIQQIAFSVGFSTPSYFARCYKEHFGVLPTDEVREI